MGDERRERCTEDRRRKTCDPLHTDDCPYVDTDDRRERYEEALRRADRVKYYETDSEYFAALSDAAMAVADEEIHSLREEMRTAFWEQHERVAQLRQLRAELMMDAKNIKVAPYGDVVLTTCTTCGTYVSDETVHIEWHRMSEFSESDTAPD